MMNKIYKEKLAYLRDNPDKIKEYAGYIHNGMFRKCKKCNGKGIISPILDNGRTINIFCSCVHDNVRKEIEEIEEIDKFEELEENEECKNGSDDKK